MPYSIDALSGRTILVVEDEYFLADYVMSAIQSAGGQVQGPFPSVKTALAHLTSGGPLPDAATMNVNLADGLSYPIAEELARLGVPFVFASAVSDAMLPQRFSRSALLIKPFAAYQVVQALLGLLERDPAPRDDESESEQVGD